MVGQGENEKALLDHSNLGSSNFSSAPRGNSPTSALAFVVC